MPKKKRKKKLSRDGGSDKKEVRPKHDCECDRDAEKRMPRRWKALSTRDMAKKGRQSHDRTNASRKEAAGPHLERLALIAIRLRSGRRRDVTSASEVRESWGTADVFGIWTGWKKGIMITGLMLGATALILWLW